MRLVSAAILLAVAGCSSVGDEPENLAVTARLQADYQRVCGVLARTGDLDATRNAAIAAGYKTDGLQLTGRRTFDFRDFVTLTKADIQISLSNASTRYRDGRFCGAVADGNRVRVSDEAYLGAAEAIARANGATTQQTPWLQNTGNSPTRDFNVGNRTVRQAYQSFPAALALSTFSNPATN